MATDVRVGRALLAGAVALVGARWAWRRWQARGATLRGKVVLITGSSRGLGHLLARLAGEEGARVVICARDAAELERARLNLAERGIDVLAIPCDVTDPAQVDRMIAGVIGHFGQIDVVVNNAGGIQVGPLDEMTLDDFRRAMDVNFWGTVHTTLAVLPHMRDRRGGRVVNITSIGGKVAMPHLLPYDCAKFAALGFSEGLRSEVAKDGVSVTTVIPGLIRTGSVVTAQFKGRTDEEFTWFAAAARNPLLSMHVRYAARRIVEAMRAGEGEMVLGWTAQLLRVSRGLMPGLTARMLSALSRALPASTDHRPPASGKEIVDARRLSTFGAPDLDAALPASRRVP
jgi:NAD(P)-dependent dehydrogenase (short-subunit alcohol dehydrogenase family)